jgi:5-methylcytosine-specific restriction protein A
MRREFPSKVKALAFQRAKGCCEQCNRGVKLLVGDVFYDHIIADGIGGDNSLDNCQVLCKSHHDGKTRKHDVPRIAKVKRIRLREAGIRKRSRFPGSRDSRFKKRMDGTVVLRDAQ